MWDPGGGRSKRSMGWSRGDRDRDRGTRALGLLSTAWQACQALMVSFLPGSVMRKESGDSVLMESGQPAHLIMSTGSVQQLL